MLKFFIFFTVLTTTAFAQNREIKNLEAYCQLLKKEKSKKFQQYATYIDFLDQTSAEVADLLNQILDQYTEEDKSKVIAIYLRRDLDILEKQALLKELDLVTKQIALKFKLISTKDNNFKIPNISKNEIATTKLQRFRLNFFFNDKTFILTLCKGSICESLNIADGDFEKIEANTIFQKQISIRKENGLIDSKVISEPGSKPNLLNFLVSVLPNECLGKEEQQFSPKREVTTISNACNNVPISEVSRLTKPDNHYIDIQSKVIHVKTDSNSFIRKEVEVAVDRKILNTEIILNAATVRRIDVKSKKVIGKLADSDGFCIFYLKKPVKDQPFDRGFLIATPKLKINVAFFEDVSSEKAIQNFELTDLGHPILSSIKCSFDFGAVYNDSVGFGHGSYRKTRSVFEKNDLTLGELRSWIAQFINKTSYMKASVLPEPDDCR